MRKKGEEEEEEELDKTDSESSPLADFNVNFINNMDSTTNNLVSFFNSPITCVWHITRKLAESFHKLIKCIRLIQTARD